ncbi:MAG: hypothetical protein DRJ64_04285 [Thermoprotei archaeon]|nr:MAG: hypothetical protein DRJ64_04285 [Thermoprotei archaeon]
MDNVLIVIGIDDDHNLSLHAGEGQNIRTALEDLANQLVLDTWPDEQYRIDEGLNDLNLDEKLDNVFATMESIFIHITFGGMTKKAIFNAYEDKFGYDRYFPDTFERLLQHITKHVR